MILFALNTVNKPAKRASLSAIDKNLLKIGPKVASKKGIKKGLSQKQIIPE